MRNAVVALVLALITTAAAAGDGPWSAPRWHLGATERHGPFVHTTSMYVSLGKGRTLVELTCTIQDVRGGRPESVKRTGTAKMAQGSWCGGAGDLGTWCVKLEEGATLEWFERTPCAGGEAQFSTGD